MSSPPPSVGLAHVANLVEHRQAAGNLDNSGQRFAVRDLREQLAELSSDVDRYVAELGGNLTHADQYRTIATALRRDDRTPEAIAWARRGLAEKGLWPNAERLRDLLVDLLIDVGDGSAALAERRAEFERRPTHAAYRDLLPEPQWVHLLDQRRAGHPADVIEPYLHDLRVRHRRRPTFLAGLDASAL